MTIEDQIARIDATLREQKTIASRLPARGGRIEAAAGGKRALILDSSQMVEYMDCPMFWNLSTNERLERVDQVDKIAMHKGTYGHKLLEVYYKTRAAGMRIDQSRDAALSFDPDATPDAEINPDSSVAPAPFPLDAAQREEVRKSFILYTHTYANGDIVPDSPDSIEVGFSTKIYEDSIWIYVLEGRVDLIGTLGGQPIWCDHKFQMRKKDLYKKSIQFRNYSLATGLTLGFVNYIRLTKEVSKDTYVRDTLSFTSAQLRWWKDELIKIFTRVARSVELNSFAQNWSACSGKFNYPCAFTPICEELSPYVRENMKKTLYKIKEEWKPW